MSVAAILGAVLVVALIHVLAGMAALGLSGDAYVALWLASLLAGVVTYVLLERAVPGSSE